MFLYGCIYANKSSAGMAAQLPGGARWGQGSVRRCPNHPGHRDSTCWRLQVSVTTSVSLGLATFPQPPGFHSLHSQVPPGPQLTSRVVSTGSQSLHPHPHPVMSPPVAGASARLGEGWGVDFQHSWPLRFPRSPLSRLPPSHTLFLSGCFFLSRTLQGQTKADWQCLLPCPLHLGKLSRGGRGGVQRVLCGGGCLLPPSVWLGTLGVPTICPTLEMHTETPLAFTAPSDWLSSLCCRRGTCACPPSPSQGHVPKSLAP